MARPIAAGKPIHIVVQEPSHGTDVEWVPGYEYPVKIALVIRGHQAIAGDQQRFQPEANLEIHMTAASAMQVFSEIRRLARTMDWPLPKEDEPPA